MDIYTDRMCSWCWDMDRLCVPAVSTVINTKDGKSTRENMCQGCTDSLPDLIAAMKEDGVFDDWFDTQEIVSLQLSEIKLFQRGDRVNVSRTNRAKQTGTVLHCYVSQRNFRPMVNVLIDGLKWPHLIPCTIVEKRVPPPSMQNKKELERMEKL